MAVRLADALGYVGLLGHTAAQADNLVWVFPLAVDQRAHVAEHPLLRVLPDGAGVDDNDVRALIVVHDGAAHVGQHPPEQLGVGLVLLAAIGVHIGPGRDGALGVAPAQFGAVFLLPLDVFSGDNGCGSFQGWKPPY